MQIIHGSAMEVLKTLPENSVDVVYTCPSPFGYYENEPNLVGGEKRMIDYVENLKHICNACRSVLKNTGSLFIQVPDVFTGHWDLAGVPMAFEYTMKTGSDLLLTDRLIWHRTENRKIKNHGVGFLKNYEIIFHFVKNIFEYYYNEKSKYVRTSVFSYPLEDSYYTNEFDSGLPYQLSEMVIDTTCPPNGVILDPLCGSGKVGVVAKKMNRDFIGIDIDLETVEACRIRLSL